MESNFTFINREYIPFSQSSVHVSDLIVQGDMLSLISSW